MQLVTLLGLSVSLVSCKHYPNVKSCVVDAANSGFQCFYKGKKYFLPLGQGLDMACSSSEDTERFIKACSTGQVLEISRCRPFIESIEPFPYFICDGGGRRTLNDVDNFFCLTDRDQERVNQRCLQRQ